MVSENVLKAIKHAERNVAENTQYIAAAKDFLKRGVFLKSIQLAAALKFKDDFPEQFKEKASEDHHKKKDLYLFSVDSLEELQTLYKELGKDIIDTYRHGSTFTPHIHKNDLKDAERLMSPFTVKFSSLSTYGHEVCTICFSTKNFNCWVSVPCSLYEVYITKQNVVKADKQYEYERLAHNPKATYEQKEKLKTEIQSLSYFPFIRYVGETTVTYVDNTMSDKDLEKYHNILFTGDVDGKFNLNLPESSNIKTLGGYRVQNFQTLPAPLHRGLILNPIVYKGEVEEPTLGWTYVLWDEFGRCSNPARKDCNITIYYGLFDTQTCRMLQTGLNSTNLADLAVAYLGYISPDLDEDVLETYETMPASDIIEEALQNSFELCKSPEPFEEE
jgi:hypothetical protein